MKAVNDSAAHNELNSYYIPSDATRKTKKKKALEFLWSKHYVPPCTLKIY
jgi:hypothetical protein